jgi:glycosyltransferase involved in cell wall biosynthesis
VANIGFVIGQYSENDLENLIERDEAPLPEYLLFSRLFSADIVTYDRITSEDAQFAELLKRRQISHWGPAVSLGLKDRPYDHIIAACEDVGLPLALNRRLERRWPDMSIITHGFLHRDASSVRAIRGVDNLQFLCLSEGIRQMILERLPVNERAVVNTGSGIDEQFFRPLHLPDQPFYIAAVGMAHRNYRTLMEAVRDLPVKVKIAAASAWSPQALDTGGIDLPHNVEVVTLSRREVRELYAGALFVVVPLYPAPFACGYAAISEAMAMGRAVITTRTQAPSDFLVDGETGLYVPPGDADALRDRLNMLLQVPERALEMGRRGRQRIEERFTQRAYCRRLQDAVVELSACSAA